MAASKPSAEQLITENIDVWTSAIKKRGSQGRGSSKKITLYGIKKLRELILELAVRGLLVPQNPNDEPASEILKRAATDRAKLIKEGGIKKQKPLPEISDEEVDFKSPDGWAWTRMGYLAQYQKGYAFKSKDYLNSGLMITKIQNLTENNILNSAYIDPERILECEQYLLCEGDIVMTTVGSWFTAPLSAVGRSFLINKLFDNSLLNQNAVRIRSWKDLDPIYLFTCINSPIFKNYLIEEAQGTANQASITQASIKNFLICIPPKKEQTRIVAKVNELMALCDQLEQQTETSLTAHQTLVETLLNTLLTAAQTTVTKESNSQSNSNQESSFDQAWNRIAQHFDVLFTTEHSIDQLKQTILQLAVMGKLVPQDPNDEPASVLLEKIAAEKEQLIKDKKIKKQKALPPIGDDEKPFELQVGWEWCRLGDLYQFLNGFAFKSAWFTESGTKLLRNINIAHSETKWIEVACVPTDIASEYSQYELEVGDIVISLDRPIINSGLKYAVIQEQDLPCLLLQRVAKFHSLGDFVFPEFLSRWLESDLFMSKINPGRSNGIPHISTKQLEMMPFPFSPQKEQFRIVTKVNELMALCDTLKERIRESQSTQLHLADAMAEQALG